MRRAGLMLACIVSTLAVAMPAYADLVVTVHAAGNTPGVTVVVTDQRGTAATCVTGEDGSCELHGVAAGSVFVEAHAGGVTWVSHAMLEGDDKASLFVPRPPTSAPPTE